MSHGAREDVHPDSRLRGLRPRERLICSERPDFERGPLLAVVRRVARSLGVSLLTAMTLGLGVAPTAPSNAASERSAAELWEAYPLNPHGSDTGAGGARGNGAATREARDPAIRYMGDERGGAVNNRLMLQLGMLLAALYAAFLCVWFTTTRRMPSFDDRPGISGRLRRVHAWTAAVASRRPQTEHRSMGADAADVWTCAIAWRRGRVRSRFRAMMAPPDGRGSRVVAQSKSLPWPPRPGETLRTAELVSALDSLVSMLVAAGWEPVESAGSWSARRFVWRREGEPPARLTLAQDQ